MRATFALVTLAVALTDGVAGAQLRPDDTSGVAATARRAQRRFESVRRANLPWEQRRAAQSCDARIGLYCFWYDSTDRIPDAPEPERVTRARRDLLATLDSLARRSPGDGIILGQRVLYRLEAGDTAEVAALLDQCETTRWWCDALLGHLHHARGNDDRAEEAFDLALIRMDSTRRCRWTDISPVLPPKARKAMRALPCERRQAAAERVWWLGDPLLTTPGNDLRAEYLARRTLAELGTDGMATYDLRWNDDAEEMLLRFGPPVWWSRERPQPVASSLASSGRPVVIGHELVPSYAFLPVERALADSVVPGPEDWALHQPLPNMRYAPARAGVRVWREFTAQLARFRRGDSLLVVGRYSTQGEPLLERGTVTLAVSTGPRRLPYLSPADSGTQGILAVRVPSDSLDSLLLAGIEVVDADRFVAGRFRTGMEPLRGGPLVISDLLLHEPEVSGAAQTSLEDVLPRALPAGTITSPRVAMYWEAYCLGPERDPLMVTLHVERTDLPLLARINARLGFDDPSRTLRIDWQDIARPDARCAARSMQLDLTELPNGTYMLRLDVRRGSATASAARSVRLRR